MSEKAKFKEDVFIARWIAGELSDKESSEFNNWLKSNPKQIKIYEELKNVWTDVGKIKLNKGHPKEKRWQRIDNVIKNRSNGKSTNH